MGLDEIARNQGGMIRRSQLVAAGHSHGSINHSLRTGKLYATRFEAVFRVAGAPLDEDAITWQTVLGSRAVLSYGSAARVWELPVEPDGLIHVTRPKRSRFDQRPNLRVHRTFLSTAAVTTYDGLTLTTRVETILDCLGWIPIGPAGNLFDRAMQQGWIGPTDVQRRLDDEAGRWGNRRLRRLLESTMPGAEAESERRVHRILKAAGITGWKGNLWVTLNGQKYRIDIGFKKLKIAIEIEGWAFHRDKDRRDRDLVKLNALQRNGWRCLTFNYEHTGDPDRILAEVNALLAAANVR